MVIKNTFNKIKNKLIEIGILKMDGYYFGFTEPEENKKIVSVGTSDVIVALTSFGSRMKYAGKAIQSILDGTIIPSKIVITLTEEDAQNMPENLKSLIDDGKVELITCQEDIKSHKKYFYVMQKYRDKPIITIDDDWVYDSKMVELLYNSYLEHPKRISCAWTRELCFDKNFKILSFEKTKRINNSKSFKKTKNAHKLMLFSGSGCLFPPDCLKVMPEDIDFVHKYLTVDDIVLLYFAKRRYVGIRTVNGINNVFMGKHAPIARREILSMSLYMNENAMVDEKGRTPNDVAMEELINPFYKPSLGISICMSAYQTKDYIKAALDSIALQKWFANHSNYEIILGIDGDNELLEYVETIKNRYRNFRVYMFEKNVGTFIVSNTIMKMAKYPYVMRFDSDDKMKRDMVGNLMQYMEEGYDYVTYHCSDTKKGEMQAWGSALFKKEIFEKFGGYRPWVCAGDYEIATRIKDFVKYINLRDILYYHTYREESLLHSKETSTRSDLRREYNDLIRKTKYYKEDKAIIECTTADCKEVFSNIVD